MKFLFKCFAYVLAVLSLTTHSLASESEAVTSGKAVTQLVTSHDRAAPGSDIYIALSQRLEPHWHTYWRNAGGPGQPVQISWTLPQDVSVSEILWPLPEIVHTGSIINYAFEDKLLLPMVLHIPDTAKAGETLTIKVEALFLVCYQVCLPESAEISLSLDIGAPLLDGRWNANIVHALKTTPNENLEFTAVINSDETGITLGISAPQLSVGNIQNPYFFPYIQDMIDADALQIMTQHERGFSLALKPGWKLEGGVKDDLVGVISFEEKSGADWERRGVIVTAKLGGELGLGAVTGPVKGPIKKAPFWSWQSLLAVFLICLGVGAFVAKRRKQ